MSIETNKHYIIEKTIGGVVKRQYAKITNVIKDLHGNNKYCGWYGYFGFHEFYCYSNEIRELTEIEKKYSDSGEFWNLPQQFYQSFPND